MSLRSDLIRLASENPSMRDDLLPLIKTALSQGKTAFSGVGKTIIDQMGGPRIGRFLGWTDLKMLPKGVEFKWPNKQRTRGNMVRIVLEPSDTYTMTFFNATANGQKVVKRYDDVYADMLVDIFERQTSWYLHF